MIITNLKALSNISICKNQTVRRNAMNKIGKNIVLNYILFSLGERISIKKIYFT